MKHHISLKGVFLLHPHVQFWIFNFFFFLVFFVSLKWQSTKCAEDCYRMLSISCMGFIIYISLSLLFHVNGLLRGWPGYTVVRWFQKILASSQTQSDDRVGYETDTSSGHTVQVIYGVHTRQCLLDVWCEERDLTWASCHDIILTIGPKMGVEFTPIELRYVYSLSLTTLLRHSFSLGLFIFLCQITVHKRIFSFCGALHLLWSNIFRAYISYGYVITIFFPSFLYTS